MKLAFKVDADTLEGTKTGVENLRRLFVENSVEAAFFFSLGEDEMGKSAFRIFQRGFLGKCIKSGVARNYPLKTLLRGTLLPARLICKECAREISAVAQSGFECGAHAWSHFKWQNRLAEMPAEEIAAELSKARAALRAITGAEGVSCASAGWQVSAGYLQSQDSCALLYASDTRGRFPFLPSIGGRVFATPQIPTTVDTLDEILCARPIDSAADFYISELSKRELSVMTIHAELEGAAYLQWFADFLKKLKTCGARFVSLKSCAQSALNGGRLPVCQVEMAPYPNRGGLIATQKLQ